MEYLITAYPSTPTPAMILTPPARAYSPSPSPDPEQEPQPVASTSQLAPSTSRRVFDYVLLPRLPAGWLSAAPGGRASEPVQDDKACHQCRNAKNPHPRFRCGRAGCLRAFCSSCLSRRYGWTPQEIHERGCPDCRGVCNCSRCLDRAGLSAHKAFLTADARAGGCARKWLAERGLLVEGAAAPQPPKKTKKNMARRPRILAKKKTQEEEQEEEEDVWEEEARGRGPGRWVIDASEKLVKRWARERAARVAQVRAGTRRWFAGASPPPRPRARDDTAVRINDSLLVETIDLTLDDDDAEDARDSLFDAKSADGDAQPARDDKTDDADAKMEDDVADAPDSLFDEKTDDEDVPEQDDAAAAAAAQNGAPDDKDDDADSLFDGEPVTPAAPSPQIPPTPSQLPPTPIQLPPTPVQLPPAPTPIQLPIQLPPTPVQLPPTPVQLPRTPVQLPPTPVQLPPTPIQLPPVGPTQDTLSRSDSYADALRIDNELGVVGPSSSAPGSPAKPFAATSAADLHAAPAPASPVDLHAAPVTDLALPPAPPPKSPTLPVAPKSPPKTFAKAASAMFIPRAKRKRDKDDEETRLESVKSSAGVLVALGRPGRAKRVREDDVHALQDDAPVPVAVPVEKDDSIAQKDDMQTQKDGAIVQKEGAIAQKDDVQIQKDGAIAQKDGAPAAQKRPREDTALADERPAKRAALSKETRADASVASPEREDHHGVDDEARVQRAAQSKETGRKPRADAGIAQGPRAADDEPPVGRAAPAKESARKPPRASSSRQEDSDVVDGLPTPKPTLDKRTAAAGETAARPSAADALAQAMRAAYGGASTADPKSSAPVASGSSAQDNNKKRGKPSVLAQRVAQASGSSLAIALKTPAPPAPSAASALAAAYKQAYAARPASPASTLRSSPTPALEHEEHVPDGKASSSPTRASKPALNDFIGGFDDEDKDEPTPELLPSDLAAQSEGSSRTGPVSPLVAHRRPPTILTDAEDGEEEMPARRPFVPCNPRRFVGMPLRYVPAPVKKRPRPVKRVQPVVIDVDEEDDDDYKDEEEDEEQDFGLARRRKRTKLWEDSVVLQSQAQTHEPVIVLDDSDDSDFQPAPALVSKGTGKGKAKSFGPGKGKSKSFGPGKGKSKPRKLPLSTFIAYSYTPPPSVPDPEPESMPEPVFVPDDDTAAAPPASEVWLGAAMAPLSPDLGLTRAVADAWFSAV